MAIILISPISVQTAGKFPAKITGIDLSSGVNGDCLAGEIITPGAGTLNVFWDNFGRCRDRTDDCNIDPNNLLVKDVIDTVKLLDNT